MTPAMNEKRDLQTARSASVIALLAGLWLFISPWVFGVEMLQSSWNSWIVGAVIVVLAAIRIGNPLKTTGLSWINCVLGIWAFVSPWVYAYTQVPGRCFTGLCAGVVVFIASIWSATKTPHTQHPAVTHS